MEYIHNTTPPYASVSKMSEMFELLRTRSFQNITPTDLKSRGFSTADAFQVLAALRFLGLLNDDNMRTNQLPKLQLLGDQGTAAMKEVVTSSYSLLFGVAPEASKLERDELINEIMAVYKVSPRVAKAAAPLFVWLCRQAGLETAENVVPRDRASKVRSLNTTPRPKSTVNKNVSGPDSELLPGTQSEYLTFPVGRIKLLVPNDEKYLSSVLSGGLKEIKEKIEEFVKRTGSDLTEETPVGLGGQAID